MRKVDDGKKEKKRKKEKEKKREKKRMAILVATTSLPAVYRLNGYAQTMTAGTLHTRAKRKKKNGVFSGHYVIASSLPPEQRPLERRTLVPKSESLMIGFNKVQCQCLIT